MKKHLNESESHMEKLSNKDSEYSSRPPDSLPVQVTFVICHRVPHLQRIGVNCVPHQTQCGSKFNKLYQATEGFQLFVLKEIHPDQMLKTNQIVPVERGLPPHGAPSSNPQQGMVPDFHLHVLDIHPSDDTNDNNQEEFSCYDNLVVHNRVLFSTMIFKLPRWTVDSISQVLLSKLLHQQGIKDNFQCWKQFHDFVGLQR